MKKVLNSGWWLIIGWVILLIGWGVWFLITKTLWCLVPWGFALIIFVRTLMIDRFVWTSSNKPREIMSANDEINDYLLYVDIDGCGIREAREKICEDFGCESILNIIELMSKEAK